MAAERELDVLLVSPTTDPPVCRMINFGQFKYQQQKKEKQSRKSGKGQVTKELKMGHKISTHDFQVRVNKCREFLEKQYKVKISVPFRGREVVHMKLGYVLIERFIETIRDLGDKEGDVINANRSLTLMINPK